MQNNENMRDLSKLNRDLSQVIFVVTESKAKTVEPADNVLVIPDYDAANAPQDTTLLDVVPLLELVWKQDVPDTRVVCRSYQGKHVVDEFRKRDSSTPRPATGGTPAGGAGARRFGLGR